MNESTELGAASAAASVDLSDAAPAAEDEPDQLARKVVRKQYD